MNREGGEAHSALEMLFNLFLFFMSFQCSLLWVGLGWKVSSRKISHLGIPVHVHQEGSGALPAALKSSQASFVVPSSPFQRGAGNEGGQTSTKPEFCSFHSWIFSHKTNPNLSSTFGFTNNDQVCIFQMKLGLKTSSEPLLEGIFCVADLVHPQVWALWFSVGSQTLLMFSGSCSNRSKNKVMIREEFYF